MGDIFDRLGMYMQQITGGVCFMLGILQCSSSAWFLHDMTRKEQLFYYTVGRLFFFGRLPDPYVHPRIVNGVDGLYATGIFVRDFKDTLDLTEIQETKIHIETAKVCASLCIVTAVIGQMLISVMYVFQFELLNRKIVWLVANTSGLIIYLASFGILFEQNWQRLESIKIFFIVTATNCLITVHLMSTVVWSLVSSVRSEDQMTEPNPQVSTSNSNNTNAEVVSVTSASGVSRTSVSNSPPAPAQSTV